jgi:hypothetical protein
LQSELVLERKYACLITFMISLSLFTWRARVHFMMVIRELPLKDLPALRLLACGVRRKIRYSPLKR